VCLYDELGVGYKAVDSLPEPALESLAQRVVGTLRDVDAREGTNLLTTLATFLGNDCSHACSAAELFVHRNTLRGRLERIAKLIDANLGTTDGVVEARLGLLASEVLATRRA
jgi:DNA-binding PucR family transcriptional regulator